MSMWKKFLAATVVTVMVVGLAACGGGTSSAPAADPGSDAPAASQSTESDAGSEASGDGVVLEWQQWWAVEAPEGYVQNIADSFYEETGIKVELLNAPFADTKTQIVSGASTGTVADIVSVDGSWVYDFADQGLLTDMSALMAADGYDLANLNDQWQVDGVTYALPVVNFAYPMFANMDLLNECGITELPKTWSEFEEVCQIIVDKGYYPFALNLDTTSPSGIQNTYMGFAWASDITMKDDSGKLNVTDNPELKEFAEFMKGLNDKGYLFPGMSSLTEPDMTSKFSSGELAFVINSMATLQSYREEAPDINISAAAIPVKDGFTGESGMCVASWALGVTENSEHKAEAMQFIEYLFSGADGTDGSINADLAVTQSAFPGSALAQPDYSNADDVFKAVYEFYAAGFPINEFIGMKEANTIMTDYIDALIPYMDGDVDVDAYFQQVQDAIDAVYNS